MNLKHNSYKDNISTESWARGFKHLTDLLQNLSCLSHSSLADNIYGMKDTHSTLFGADHCVSPRITFADTLSSDQET